MVVHSEKELFLLLREIPDPEIPVLSIVDLGVIRSIKIHDDIVEIAITPTYSGCPAMKQMEDDIVKLLSLKGFEKIHVKTIYQPTWTTDWLSDEAKEKLRKYGIAPPAHSKDKSTLMGKEKKVACPRCGSTNTELVSQFGSTACKALYRCKNCLEPFDHFKCI